MRSGYRRRFPPMRPLTAQPPALAHSIDLSAAFGVAVAILVFIAVMALISGRLLGVRTPAWRAIASSVIGCAGGIAAAYEVDRHHVGSLVLLSVLFGVLGTMVVAILIELLAPAPSFDVGHRGLTEAITHPIEWAEKRLSPITRSWGVLRDARRRGLARFQFMSPQALTTAEFGRKLRLTLEDAGGMFVKFGQIASTRGDLLSEAVVSELAQLRASVRPIPSDLVQPLVEAELGCTIDEVFRSVDWEPLAAASIGQIHRAVLRTGEHVVLKIQRPGMQTLMERDARVLRLVASIAERRLPGARRLGIRDLAEDLVVSLRQELDYLREAAMSERLAAQTEGSVHIPAVYDAFSTSRLLVMEEVEGHSVGDRTAVSLSGCDPEVLARSLLRTVLRQVLDEGVFHADPHPGNVFVDPSCRLWLLDFGAVGVLDPGSRMSLQEITLGMTLGEPVIVARAVRKLSGNAADTDLRQLTAEIGTVMVESSLEGFDPRLLRQVLSVMERNGLRVPRSVTQLSRSLLTLDGTLQTLATGFDLRHESSVIIRQLQAVEDEDRGDVLRTELMRALPSLRAMPEHFDEIATQLRAGHLSMRLERFAGRDEQVTERWIDRAVVATVGVGTVLASALLLVAAGLTHSRDVTDALRAIGFIGLVMSTGLLLRSVAQAFQRNRPSDRT